MADYAQIIDGKVNMIVIDDVTKFNELVASGLTIIDVTSEDPKPSTGWTYDGSIFAAPVYRWAKVISNSVTEILELNVDAAQSHVNETTQMINLQFETQDVQVGWGYVDGVFSAL